MTSAPRSIFSVKNYIFIFLIFFSARPLYLKERAQSYQPSTKTSPMNSLKTSPVTSLKTSPMTSLPETPTSHKSDTLEKWKQQQELERERIRRLEQPTPPKRPPKKPHLRGDTPPPATPPRGQTPVSRSASATPTSNHSSRGATPTGQLNRTSLRHSRPKYPSPPGSPRRLRSPTPPPPPSPHPSSPLATPPQGKELPLPPPPSGLGQVDEEKMEMTTPTLR